MLTPPLTPAEALVLLSPRHSLPREALKVTLLSLVAQGVLKMSTAERPGFFRRRTVPVVLLAKEAPPEPEHVFALTDIVHQAQKTGIGADIASIAKVACQAYGPKLDQFKTRFLLPALVRRGLLAEETDVVLGLFKRKVHVYTPAGLVEKNRLDALIDRARRVPALLRTDPAAAAAIVLAAGATLLLVPELKPHYAQLAALKAPGGADSGAGDNFFAGDNSLSDASGSGFDFGSVDFASFDFDAFSGLDVDFSSFDASFDSSFDSGGGDGGGDSGGGHH